MLKKLSFLLITAMILAAFTACGSDRKAASKMEYGLASGVDPLALSAPPGSGPTEEIPEAPERTACDAEYFLFTKSTNTLTDESGQPLLYENQTIPTFFSTDSHRSEWVSGLLAKIARDFSTSSSNLYDYAQEYIAQNGTEYFYSHSNYQQLGVARHDDTVVSLLSLSSLYSGGSHPNSVQTAYNLDIENQRILRLEDVISEEAAPELAALVRAGVDEKFNEMGLFEDYADTIDRSMVYGNMTPYWYLNDTGLVVFYNQYELGPYAAGIIKVELPYGDLEGILMDQFHPIASTGIPGDMLLRGAWKGYHSIPITIEAEGETLLVGVEGKVYQVQLSEVFWLEDTPIAQELIFSARTLCQNDVLEITGGFDDETRSFVIEFIDGLGEQRIYYLHVGELTEEP